MDLSPPLTLHAQTVNPSDKDTFDDLLHLCPDFRDALGTPLRILSRISNCQSHYDLGTPSSLLRPRDEPPRSGKECPKLFDETWHALLVDPHTYP